MELRARQLRAARGCVNWSQRELARKLKISYPTMNHYENGLTIPPERMERIVSLFEDAGVSFVDLLEGKGVILRCNKTNGA